jgi:hypothetical protein
MRCVAAIAALAFASTAPAIAQKGEAVDVELILAVDVSLSMSPDELGIQRDGYAAALVHEDVLNAIADGAHGKIAVTYVEWAGDFMQQVVVPWTVIATRADAEAFVAKLTASPPNSARRTSVSGALLFSRDLFAESRFAGMKRVVDISGDGPNNQGPPVVATRDELVKMGITINGLPLMTNGGMTSSYDLQDLDTYYAQCVIGGPGAFMVPVNDWSAFPEAVRRKLVLELAGWPAKPDNGPPVMLAASEPGYDCMVGEKMWMDRSWMWRN